MTRKSLITLILILSLLLCFTGCEKVAEPPADETAAGSVSIAESTVSSEVAAETTAETTVEAISETTAAITEAQTAASTTAAPADNPQCSASITSAVIYSANNYGFGSDVTGEIQGDKIIFNVSLISEKSVLSRIVPTITVDYGSFSFNGDSTNPDGTVDLLSSAGCTVTVTDNDGLYKTYTVETNYTPLQLPVVSLSTGGTEIQREEYIDAAVKIICEDVDDEYLPSGYSSLDETAVKIRGRGHSTWNMMPKKPYKLKFDKKVSVLGLREAKEWILLANYADMSLIRNTVAYETAAVADKMGFTPTQYPVNLFVDGKYAGVYTIGEHMEVKDGRVELSGNTYAPDTSFLLEIGGAEHSDEFDVSAFHAACFRWCKIKYPKETEITPEQVSFIGNYVIEADRAIAEGTGYEKYVDVDSMVDWLIIHELFYNLESCFRRSCYFTKDANGLLKMGPVWDFDLAMGNLYNDFGDYSSWMCLSQKNGYIEDNWFCYLMNDDSFRARLRTRWDEIKNELLESATGTADYMGELISPSAYYNFMLWPTLGTRSVDPQPLSITELDTYEKHLSYVKSFIVNRWNWLDANI